MHAVGVSYKVYCMDYLCRYELCYNEYYTQSNLPRLSPTLMYYATKLYASQENILQKITKLCHFAVYLCITLLLHENNT